MILELTNDQVAALREAARATADAEGFLDNTVATAIHALNNPLDTVALNAGRWQGQAFWSGLAIGTGEIVRVFQYEIAADADFNAGFLVSGDLFGGIGEGLIYFYINNGTLEAQTYDGDPVANEILEKIRQQIEIKEGK